MKYILPASAVGLLFLWLWTHSIHQRLTVLEENVDRALENFNVRQICRLDALTALMRLIEEHSPRTVWARPDVIRSYCIKRLEPPALEDIAERDLIIFQILTQIVQALRQHPEIRSEWRYFQYLGAMSAHENISRTSRLLYNDSVSKLNRELLFFPASVLGHILGVHKREYMISLTEGTPIYNIFPSALSFPYGREEDP